MSATQQQRNMPPAERDAETQAAPLHSEPTELAPHGNDNLEQARAVEELTQVKKRTWETFARWLMIGGVLFALLLLAVLTFVYSRYS
jgi:hypothetical protein